MANQQIIAGVDSSTQSVKVVMRDAHTGQLVRQGRAAHPEGTEVDPTHWKNALDSAIKEAGGLEDVQAISIAGQQHGMVALDSHGEVIRPALLWNDTRSAKAAEDCDICIIVGTSMQVFPANQIPFLTKEDCLIYLLAPVAVENKIQKTKISFGNSLFEKNQKNNY